MSGSTAEQMVAGEEERRRLVLCEGSGDRNVSAMLCWLSGEMSFLVLVWRLAVKIVFPTRKPVKNSLCHERNCVIKLPPKLLPLSRPTGCEGIWKGFSLGSPVERKGEYGLL